MTDKEIDYKILQRENENLLKANEDLVRKIEKIQEDFIDKVAKSEIRANEEAFTHWQNECENKITIENMKAVKEFADKIKLEIRKVVFIQKDEILYWDNLIDELLEEYEK